MKSRLDPFALPSSVIARDSRVRSGVDAPEYTTRWSPFDESSLDHSEYIADRSKLVYEAKRGSISVAHWRPRDIELIVDLHLPTQISVRQFYFPNWRATIHSRSSLPVVPSTQNGLILLTLPAGHYRLRLDLEPLPQETIGVVVTLGGLLSFLILSTWRGAPRSFLSGSGTSASSLTRQHRAHNSIGSSGATRYFEGSHGVPKSHRRVSSGPRPVEGAATRPCRTGRGLLVHPAPSWVIRIGRDLIDGARSLAGASKWRATP
jgi:hypothetical protein